MFNNKITTFSDTSHLELYLQYRDHLFVHAYKMLGEVHETEDVLQEVYLEWRKVDLQQLDSVEAMLKTITIRRAIDALRRKIRRKEDYIGPWLPEPFITEEIDRKCTSPQYLNEQAEKLSVGFMLILENMGASERAVYILKSAFDYRYSEISKILGLSVANCRQLFRRAKQSLTISRAKSRINHDQHRTYLSEFKSAIETGSIEKFTDLLAEDVVLYSDGGGKVVSALRPIFSAKKVGRLVFGLANKMKARQNKFKQLELNHAPALLWFDGDALQTVVIFDIDDRSIDKIFMIRNPDKIRHLY